MGAAASITGRQDSDAQLIPTLKVTRKENIIRIKSTRSLKKTRRPSFFDERSKSDSGDMEMDSLILESTEGEVLNPTTRGILVRAVEEFLTMNGTDLRSNVIDVVVNSMHPLLLHRGQSVITQGEIGSFVYVLESGNVAVIVNGQEVRTMSSGTLFGELALLFDARRSATITCLEKCKLWSLNRSAFKIIQRNATNLAIMQRTRRFQVVPELAVLPSEALARLVTSLAPMSYKFGDQIYTLGKCSTKVMLIEEGKVEILVPPNLQHLTQEEIERTVGVIRPASYEYRRKSASGQESNSQSTEEVTKIEAFSISEGCIIGMSILLGKIGSPCGWTWVDAKVDGKPYVGAMPPVTATAEGVVKTSFFTVYRFERILGSAEAFYESYFGISAGTEKAKLWPFNIVPHTEPQEDPEPFKFQPEGEFCLSYFDTIVPIHSVNMGYFALGYKSGVGANVNKYLLKRLFKSTIASQNTVKHVLDEAKILEAMNSSFILRMLGRFQTPDELVFVLESAPSGDLWTLIHERDELRDKEGFLSIDITRFYIANIILALEHMHDRKVAYRNLKPENVLMNSNGYIKVTGMAFAKIVPFVTPQGSLRVSTFTFCGTLEYLSPEVVLNSGHDQGVDRWALGVLMYEMLTGMTPFEVLSPTPTTLLEATSEKLDKGSHHSKCRLRRSKSDNRMKEKMGVRGASMDSTKSSDRDRDMEKNSEKDREKDRVLSADTCTSTRLLSMFSNPAVTTSAKVTHTDNASNLLQKRSCSASDAFFSGEENEETIISQHSSNGSRRDLDRNLSRGDSVTSVGSDLSDIGYRLDGRNHEDAQDLGGDCAAKLLAAIAAVKSTGVDLPDDLSDLEDSAEIISLIMQLLNPDPLERLEIRRDYVCNIFQQGFFFDFDWAALAAQETKSPFMPTDQHCSFMNSKFSKKTFGEKFEGDDSIFNGF